MLNTLILTYTPHTHINYSNILTSNSHQTQKYFLITIFPCRGAFSIVKRCVQKSTGLEFAAKIINTKKLTTRGTEPKSKSSNTIYQIRTWNFAVSFTLHSIFIHRCSVFFYSFCLNFWLKSRRFPKIGTRSSDMPKITTSEHSSTSWQHSRGELPLSCVRSVSWSASYYCCCCCYFLGTLI